MYQAIFWNGKWWLGKKGKRTSISTDAPDPRGINEIEQLANDLNRLAEIDAENARNAESIREMENQE